MASTTPPEGPAPSTAPTELREGLTPRLHEYVERTYADASVAAVIEGLGELADAGYDPAMMRSERVFAAAVILGDGDLDQFGMAVDLGLTDWRDLLVAAGLADEDWPEVLDDILGPST